MVAESLILKTWKLNSTQYVSKTSSELQTGESPFSFCNMGESKQWVEHRWPKQMQTHSLNCWAFEALIEWAWVQLISKVYLGKGQGINRLLDLLSLG